MHRLMALGVVSICFLATPTVAAADQPPSLDASGLTGKVTGATTSAAASAGAAVETAVTAAAPPAGPARDTATQLAGTVTRVAGPGGPVARARTSTAGATGSVAKRVSNAAAPVAGAAERVVREARPAVDAVARRVTADSPDGRQVAGRAESLRGELTGGVDRTREPLAGLAGGEATRDRLAGLVGGEAARDRLAALVGGEAARDLLAGLGAGEAVRDGLATLVVGGGLLAAWTTRDLLSGSVGHGFAGDLGGMGGGDAARAASLLFGRPDGLAPSRTGAHDGFSAFAPFSGYPPFTAFSPSLGPDVPGAPHGVASVTRGTPHAALDLPSAPDPLSGAVGGSPASGASSTFSVGGLALLLATLSLAGPALRRRLPRRPVMGWPAAFVPLLERPG